VIEHRPIEQMWMDINTKPKQGSVFHEFRGHVMGIPADYIDIDYAGMVVTMPPILSMIRIARVSKPW
jgi:hypothetical protein